LPAGNWFTVLGPVRAWQAGAELDVGSAQQRAVLAVLLLRNGTPTSVEEIIDALWDEDVPGSAASTVRTYVSRLRRMLEDSAAAGSEIRSVAGGYQLDLSVDELDLTVFQRHVTDAERARQAGDVMMWAKELVSGLDLWHGTPLAGLPGPFAARQRANLERLRASAEATRLRAELDLGEPDRVLPELAALADEHPLDERLREVLIIGLYRAGRQADALAAYEEIRSLLADELGIDPGPALQALHERILRADPTLMPAMPVMPSDAETTEPALPSERGASIDALPVKLAQLPPDLRSFSGRAAQLRQVDALLAEPGPRYGPLIVLVSGTAGVGKTAFAIHWAHQIAKSFPDGQLYLNLRGFDPGGSPLTADEAVGIALQSLGVAAARLPTHPDARSVLYRSMLAGRRILLLLDNARDADQIRPLLAGGQDSVIIVTSRMQLTGIVAEYDARLVALDLFSDAESREMLSARLGTRLKTESGEVDSIIDRCARLPLALTVVAARAAGRPAFSMADVAAELDPGRRRLDAFGNTDPAIDVRTVFSWSYHGLTPTAASMFRLLSLHPGQDITLASAASLAGLPLPETRQALDELADAALLIESARGRFSWHDLLRAYAEEVCAATDERHDRRAAEQRLLAHYTHSAHAVALVLNPHRHRTKPPPVPPHVILDTPATYAEAVAWTLAEHANVTAAAAYAEATGLYREVFDLASAIDTFYVRADRWQDRTVNWQLALAAAEKLGDLDLVTASQAKLGQAHADRGDQARAGAYIVRALEVYQAREQWANAADCYISLGVMAHKLGDFPRAIEYYEAAMDVATRANHKVSIAVVLNNVGWSYLSMGQYDRAIELCSQALDYFEEASDSYGVAQARDSLAHAYRGLGRRDLVIAYARQAADAFIELVTRVPAAVALCLLGEAYEAEGKLPDARTTWEQAVRILSTVEQPEADPVRDQLESHLNRSGGEATRQ
jgi:DNA-binding SARP family transcriptional activator/tetratricopeptide (TPR) repeat protein